MAQPSTMPAGKTQTPWPYGMMVVGTDGSDSALGAVERAAEIAEGSGALVLVVCASSAMTRREQAVALAQLGDPRFDQVIGEDAAETALAAACTRAQDSGATRVESRLVDGDAVHVLLQVAEERAADLIGRRQPGDRRPARAHPRFGAVGGLAAAPMRRPDRAHRRGR